MKSIREREVAALERQAAALERISGVKAPCEPRIANHRNTICSSKEEMLYYRACNRLQLFRELNHDAVYGLLPVFGVKETHESLVKAKNQAYDNLINSLTDPDNE